MLFVNAPGIRRVTGFYSYSNMGIAPCSFPVFSEASLVSSYLSELVGVFPSKSAGVREVLLSKVLVSRARTKIIAYANSFFAGMSIGVGGMDDGAMASLVTIVSVGMLFFLVFTLPVVFVFWEIHALVCRLRRVSTR